MTAPRGPPNYTPSQRGSRLSAEPFPTFSVDDVIGVADDVSDEYDGYIGGLYGLLQREVTAAALDSFAKS